MKKHSKVYLTETSKEILKAIFMFSVIVILAFLAPLLFIWSINTLFTLEIPYSANTWAAAFVLLFCLKYKTT